MIRVLVFYRALPAYRVDILRELAHSDVMRVVTVSGDKARGHIKTLPPGLVPRHRVQKSFTLGALSFESGVVRYTRRTRCDVLVVAPALTSVTTWGAVMFARLVGIKVFLWGQCGRPGERGPHRYAKEVLNRLAHGLLVYGESEAEAACILGLRRSRVHIVGNAFRSLPEGSGAAPSLEGVGGCDVVLTYVGRLTSARRLDMIIRTAATLRGQGLNVGVIAAGEGDVAESLELLSKKLGVPCVLPGAVHSREGLAHIYRKSSVSVSPGGVGLFAVQSISHGVRIVAPNDPTLNGPEAEAIVSGVSGDVFSAGKQSDLDNAVRRVLALPDSRIDATEQERLTEAWSPEAVARRIEAAIVSGHRLAAG